MHKTDEGYRRRATECFAFAKNARDEEERTRLLVMAKILEALAVEREQRSGKAHRVTPRRIDGYASAPAAADKEKAGIMRSIFSRLLRSAVPVRISDLSVRTWVTRLSVAELSQYKKGNP